MKRINTRTWVVLFLCMLAALLLGSCASCQGSCQHAFDAFVTIEEPSCTNMGTRRHTCTICGVVENEPIKALGHTFVWITDKEATEEQTGSCHEACVVCGFLRQEDVVIPVLPHTHRAVHVVALEPTCTVDGNWEYYYCVGCFSCFTDAACTQMVDRASLTRSALGHSFTEYVPNGDATENADGTKTAVCDHGCGERETVTDSGSILRPRYTVTFYDIDGVTVLDVQTVYKGEDAIPPIVSSNPASSFLGWQGSYTNVTEDCVVYAVGSVKENVFVFTPESAEDGALTVALSLLGQVRIAAFEMDIVFDPSKLRLQDVQEAGALSIVCHVVNDGVIRFNFVDDEDLVRATELLRLTFRSLDTAESSTEIHMICRNASYWDTDAPGRLCPAAYTLVPLTVYPLQIALDNEP